MYEIGRANRPEMYDLHYHRPAPLVRRELRLEVRERMTATGEVLIPLDEDSLRASVGRLVDAGVGALAIVLLHAYVNPAHELRCAELVSRSGTPSSRVSLSHRIANEWREYERTSTTVVNAADRRHGATATCAELEAAAERRRACRRSVHVMQSNGGMTTARRAQASSPVNTLLSGPVGGAIAAAQSARQEHFATRWRSTWAAPASTSRWSSAVSRRSRREAILEGQPLLLPVIDVHTIGAGGGSVAYASAAGLRVGPRSAGALPGPACYGRGGTEPTVTDANVLPRPR